MTNVDFSSMDWTGERFTLPWNSQDLKASCLLFSVQPAQPCLQSLQEAGNRESKITWQQSRAVQYHCPPCPSWEVEDLALNSPTTANTQHGHEVIRSRGSFVREHENRFYNELKILKAYSRWYKLLRKQREPKEYAQAVSVLTWEKKYPPNISKFEHP